MVIIPRIEYQLAAIILSKKECNNMTWIVKKREGLAKTMPNYIIYEKDLYSIKTIYDLQMEMSCKNLLYQANGNEKLKKIFKIKLIQEQNIIWTAKCLGDYDYNLDLDKNNWIKMAIKVL